MHSVNSVHQVTAQAPGERRHPGGIIRANQAPTAHRL
jgi:hypothetical protein